MSDQSSNTGVEVYVRGNVTQNSKGWTKEHTVSIKARATLEAEAGGTVRIWLDGDASSGRVELDLVLDSLHQEADRANQREIQRQQLEQIAAIQAGQ